MAYDFGHGVPQNYALALKSFRKDAVQGDAQAQFSLGVLYVQGAGVPFASLIAFISTLDSIPAASTQRS